MAEIELRPGIFAEASAAYDRAARQHFGEFAHFNSVGGA